jgi:hypothetical protein
VVGLCERLTRREKKSRNFYLIVAFATSAAEESITSASLGREANQDVAALAPRLPVACDEQERAAWRSRDLSDCAEALLKKTHGLGTVEPAVGCGRNPQ